MRFTLNRLVAKVTGLQLLGEGHKDVEVFIPGVGYVKVVGVQTDPDTVVLQLEEYGRTTA